MPEVSIVTLDGANSATLLKTEIKKEWHITKYRATERGLYRLTVKAPSPAEEPGSQLALAEWTRHVLVK